MRTYEERVQELHKRMETLKKAQKRKYYCAVGAASGCVCAAVILFALLISRIPIQSPGKPSNNTSASMFLENRALGYVIVAFVALCLGIALTIFCFRLKKYMYGDQSDDRKI